jgi:hypothetical protein
VGQLIQQGYLKASNTGIDDQFAFNLALDGDTLVVGAPFEDSNATGGQGDNSAQDSGAVYVFTRASGVWSQQAYLKASNTGAGDQFGVSVAIKGDTLVVGAQFEDSGNGSQSDESAQDAGAAYVFTRSGGVWTQQAYLKANNAGANDQFGINVAVDGATVAVGAAGEASGSRGIGHDPNNDDAPGSGAVYIFTLVNGVWSQHDYIKASNGGGEFGTGLALLSDTLVVGAPTEAGASTGIDGDQDNNTAPGAGAVYVFTRSGGVWSQQAYVKASNTDAGDRFGEDVAIDGDSMVVGARLEQSGSSGVNSNQDDDSAPNAGAAYVFTRTNGVWTQQAYLKPSHAGAGMNFSGTIAIAGDIIAVGARLEDGASSGINQSQTNLTAADAGAVYVFKRSAGVWDQKDYLKASNTRAGAQFGDAVGLSGTTLAVGSWFESSNAVGVNNDQTNTGAPNSGAVYVFDGL